MTNSTKLRMSCGSSITKRPSVKLSAAPSRGLLAIWQRDTLVGQADPNLLTASGTVFVYFAIKVGDDEPTLADQLASILSSNHMRLR
jgi:hypothetical protein